MKLKRTTLIAVLAFALVVSACGPKTIHTAAVISEQAAGGLVTAQKVITTAYQAGAITEPTYLDIQKRFEQIGNIGLAADQALREGDAKTALVQIAAGLKVVQAMIDLDIPKISESQRVFALIAVQGVRSGLLAYAAAIEGGV